MASRLLRAADFAALLGTKRMSPGCKVTSGIFGRKDFLKRNRNFLEPLGVCCELTLLTVNRGSRVRPLRHRDGLEHRHF